MSGRVIGVNTAIFSRSGGNVGIGFAIPSDLAVRTTKQIIEQGKVTYGWLGVVIQDVNSDMANSLGLSPNTKGAMINSVTPGAPAAKAGLKRGDFVTSFNGQKIEGSSDLTRRVGQTGVGEVVRLEVTSADGSRRTVSVTIAARPSEQQLTQNNPLGGDRGEESKPAMNSLGMSVGPLSAQARTRLRLQPTEAGVLILDIDPDSRAAERGIRPGDAILTANGKEVRSAEDLEAEVSAARAAGRAFIGLFVQSQTGVGGFVALPLEDKPAGSKPSPKN
jgi:serine protease Do